MLAIVPVGGPAGAKGRLAGVLTPGQRAALVDAMLEDVLAACAGAPEISGILVVSPHDRPLPAGVALLADRGRGHAAAIALALRQSGGDGALVLMADCPLVRPESLSRLARLARPVAIAPARDGGTNALALRPAGVVEPAFGVEGGAAIVLERCRAAGLPAEIVDDPELRDDVDTPADLEAVLEHGAGTRTGAFLADALASAPMP